MYHRPKSVVGAFIFKGSYINTTIHARDKHRQSNQQTQYEQQLPKPTHVFRSALPFPKRASRTRATTSPGKLSPRLQQAPKAYISNPQFPPNFCTSFVIARAICSICYTCTQAASLPSAMCNTLRLRPTNGTRTRVGPSKAGRTTCKSCKRCTRVLWGCGAGKWGWCVRFVLPSFCVS